MTPENPTSSSVLRQTCDRCRKLKVRCQKSPSKSNAQGDSPVTCARCSKAGSKCAFSGKYTTLLLLWTLKGLTLESFSAPYRSGRPPTSRHGQVWSFTGAKATKHSPISSPLPPCLNSNTPSRVSPRSTSPSSQDSWPTPWFDFTLNSFENSFELDQFHPAAEFTPDFLPLEWDAPIGLENVLDLAQEPCDASVENTASDSILSSCTKQRNAGEDEPSPQSIENDVKGLSDLNIHIHEMTSSATMSTSSEELTYVTCRMLMAFGKAIEVSTQMQREDCTSQSSMSSDIAEGLERRFIEADIHRVEGSSSSRFLDSGTFLMIFTSYHGLLNLFKQVFISIHKSLAQEDLASHEKRTGHDHVVLDEDDFENDCLKARAVMKTELINHLLGRVDRGFRQFIAALGSKNTAGSPKSTSHLHDLDLSPTSPDRGLPPRTSNSHFCTQSTLYRGGEPTEDVLMLPSVPVSLGASSLVESTARKQQLLYDHVEIIKKIVCQSCR